jgi:hypothetical protein
MATVEADAKWPGMWRVRFGGKLSDMANLSRAKDAAMSLVLRELNTGGFAYSEQAKEQEITGGSGSFPANGQITGNSRRPTEGSGNSN